MYLIGVRQYHVQKLIMSSYRKHASQIAILSSLGLLVAVRVTRRWNQTGQKWAGEPDIARTFFSGHKTTLWALVGATYLWNLQSLGSRAFPRLPQFVGVAIATTLSTAAITFKLAFTSEDSPELMAGPAKALALAHKDLGVSLVSLARIVFIGLAAALAYMMLSGFTLPKPAKGSATMRSIHNLLVMLLITQSRATNIPLLLVFETLFDLLRNLDLGILELSTTSLLLQYTSFFAFGGSIGISSIDLSSAYNGVSG